MAEIKAFKGLRYTEKPGDIKELVCPPYDIISEEERLSYIKRNPFNIIRLELPRDGSDPYAEAGDIFKDWLDNEILKTEDCPAVYIYEEEFTAYGEGKKIKGIVTQVKLEPFENNVVLPHEETLSKAKTDRFNLMNATNANFSSIYSLYFDEKLSIWDEIERFSSRGADIEFTADDGIIQRVWIIRDTAFIESIENKFADKKLYIADGHHRYETALNYQNHLKDKGVITNETHPANYVMMTLVNMENPGLVVFPTHRIVRNLESFDALKLLKACDEYFETEEVPISGIEKSLDSAVENGKKAFAFYCGKKAFMLTLKDINIMDEVLKGMSPTYRQLDVCVLHNLILEKIFGIDKENMANQKNLIYTRDINEAIKEVDNNNADCCFIINPTKVKEIADVAGAGEKMPQKSTYFYPKLITGHVMNLLG